MIIGNVIGGLGNQMFQYAAARALSLHRGKPLKLDLSRFSSYALHQGFELLRVFNCTSPIASENDIHNVLGVALPARLRTLLGNPYLRMVRPNGMIVEPHFHHWAGFHGIQRDCLLMGHWQSEKYFCNYEDVIRKDFRFSLRVSDRNAALLQNIGASNAISMHVRRGDYVTNPKAQALHGSAAPAYYAAAMRHVVAHCPEPVFFVFSDDIPWVRSNMVIPSRHVFVDHNQGQDSFVDMQLMSACRHHIIANSSFSWWGAWLNPSPSKLVVAPRAWFAKPGVDTSDLLPAEWIRL